MNLDLLKFLHCPSTGKKLNLSEDELITDNSQYPIIENIPWLFKNPEFSFLEWATKIENFISQENSYISYLNILLQGEKNKITIKKYQKLIDAKINNLNQFKKTLSVFQGQQSIKLIPSNQQISSYFQLIFRDWCWNTDELDVYSQYINSSLKDKNDKNIVILGSGSCGLSQKVALDNPDHNIYSIDHNPFLIFTAQKVLNNEEFKLIDYSNFPKNLASTTRNWTIKLNQEPLDNHQLILGSFPDLPFAKNSLDYIVAPWFFDIIDFSLKKSIHLIKKYLKPDGEIIFIGPANFNHQDIESHLCPEEIIHEFQDNFKDIESFQQSINYLQNPINAQNRIEDVLFLKAKSKTQSENTEGIETLCLKYSPELEELKATTKISSDILELITKDTDVDGLSKLLIKKYLFSKEEALYYAESFIKRIQQQL